MAVSGSRSRIGTPKRVALDLSSGSAIDDFCLMESPVVESDVEVPQSRVTFELTETDAR
jgi:hypothetical protein